MARLRAAGLLARLWEGRCLQELGKYNQALGCYRELMDLRVEVCRKHDVTLEKIQSFIGELPVFEGSREFLDWIRERYQLVILSDTYYEFADHFMQQLGRPALFCHSIAYNAGVGRLEYAALPAPSSSNVS